MTAVNCSFDLDKEFSIRWKQPKLYKIVCDYEEWSVLLACRLLISNQLCFAYPLLSSPYFFCSTEINISRLESMSGLKTASESRADVCEELLFSLQRAVVFYIYHTLLTMNFVLTNPFDDVYKTLIIRRSGNLDCNKAVYMSLLNCVLSPEGDGMLRCSLTTATIIPLPYLLPQQAGETEAAADLWDDSFDFLLQEEQQAQEEKLSLLDKKCMAMHTGQDYTLLHHFPYNNQPSTLMTESNLRQQGMDYCEYIPTTWRGFCSYWSMMSGLKIEVSDRDLQLAHVKDDVSDRIIPYKLLAKNVVEISSTEGHDEAAQDLLDALSKVDILHEVRLATTPTIASSDGKATTSFVRASRLLKREETKSTTTVHDDEQPVISIATLSKGTNKKRKHIQLTYANFNSR